MITVPASIPVLRWAADRAGLSDQDVSRKFPRWRKWLSGEAQPTMRQLEDFAKRARVPFGYLFLPEPPAEPMPIPDFRTLTDRSLARPSPDLLDIIYAMQQRQDWLREDQLVFEADPLPFVGSARLSDEPAAIGREMRRCLGLDDGWAAGVSTWTQAVSELRRAIEGQGVMAVINGVVGNNTQRKLDVDEFRGFALSDPFAPLIFVNGADAKSAQMFTLMHELAHIWLGESALSDVGLTPIEAQRLEVWCNQAAAESLVPAAELLRLWPAVKRESERFALVARHFKVSPIVAARRALDRELIDRRDFFVFYDDYREQERERERGRKSGGNFYNNQNTRVGELFTTRLVQAALEGRTGFLEAYRLTGLKGGTFQKYVRRLGYDLP